MEITYLLNSGFLVRVEDILLVFDDFEDPAGVVDKAVAKKDFEALYVFSSHAHFDHFSPHVRKYEMDVTKYIFSNDIRRTKRVKEFRQDQIAYMKTYEHWEDGCIMVDSYDSTDVGTSFLVTVGKRKIFHAGDFNWWDWPGDTEENRKFARNGFRKQMKQIDGMNADIAFFPVDGRLETSMELGAQEFCKRTAVQALVAMHRVGYPAWTPSENFFEKEEKISIWSPCIEGERRIFDEKGELRA